MTELSAELFEPYVGSTFRIVGLWQPEGAGGGGGGEPPALDAPLELVRVHRLDYAGPFEQFRLTFRGSSAQALEQDTYLVSHEAFESLSLFLVPSADDGSTRTYEVSLSIARGAERTRP